MKTLAMLILLSSTSLCNKLTGSNSTESNTHNTWTFSRIEHQTIFFDNGRYYKTNLYDLNYIGQLPTEKKAPYLILSGKGCRQCDTSVSIYIVSPSDGAMKSEHLQAKFVYPGKVMDHRTNKAISESQMFYGKCLDGSNNTVVWLEKNLGSNGRWFYSSFVVKVVKDTLKEEKLSGQLKFNTKNAAYCRELQGTNQTTEP